MESWRVRSLLVVAVAIALAAPAGAELGDYSASQTAWNLILPPGPTNPVSPAEQQGPYPLKASPTTFSDGFQPGRYYEWQTIQLHPSTDAVCGNGTPYKFFVNRVPNTRNTIDLSRGRRRVLGRGELPRRAPGSAARATPTASPTTIMSLTNPGDRPGEPLRVPAASVFAREDAGVEHGLRALLHGRHLRRRHGPGLRRIPNGVEPPLVWHHNGARNVLAVLAWLKNHLPRPTQMLTAGCSAGSIGALADYELIRGHMAPTLGFLIDDSGPAFSGADERRPGAVPVGSAAQPHPRRVGARRGAARVPEDAAAAARRRQPRLDVRRAVGEVPGRPDGPDALLGGSELLLLLVRALPRRDRERAESAGARSC